MRVRRSLVLAVGALVAMAFGALSPADAGQGQDVNTFRVVKVVDGPVPAGSVFEVQVVCTLDAPASPATETVPPTILQFDEEGNPIGPDSVGVGFFEECRAEETEDAGAASVAYGCQVAQVSKAPDEGVGQVNCVDDQTVHFGDVAGAEGTITVTNTFEDAPPPPPPPPPDVEPDTVVAATPTFTG